MPGLGYLKREEDRPRRAQLSAVAALPLRWTPAPPCFIHKGTDVLGLARAPLLASLSIFDNAFDTARVAVDASWG